MMNYRMGAEPRYPSCDRPFVRVSVIMIFLNARRYIEDAIESVIAQTIVDWELILVDDGSTDGSRALALSYVAKMPERIRLHEHSGRVNRGTGPSRNLGMSVARGEYLAFLDADDEYTPERLARCADLLDTHPEVDVVISRELYWRRWGVARPISLLPDRVIGPSAELNVVIPPPKLIVSTLATRGAAITATCGLTFRRSVIGTIGGIPEDFTSQYEDQVLLVKLLLNCSAIVIGDCLARYRQHPDSLTHVAQQVGDYRPGEPCSARRKFILWLEEYCRDQAIDEPILKRTLANELSESATHSPRSRIAGIGKGVGRWLLKVAGAFIPRSLTDTLLIAYWARKDARLARRAIACANQVAARRGMTVDLQPICLDYLE